MSKRILLIEDAFRRSNLSALVPTSSESTQQSSMYWLMRDAKPPAVAK